MNLKEALNALIKKDSSALNRETLDKLKGIERDIEELGELLYSDIKNATIAEPIQLITKTQGTDINFRLQ